MRLENLFILYNNDFGVEGVTPITCNTQLHSFKAKTLFEVLLMRFLRRM